MPANVCTVPPVRRHGALQTQCLALECRFFTSSTLDLGGASDQRCTLCYQWLTSSDRLVHLCVTLRMQSGAACLSPRILLFSGH